VTQRRRAAKTNWLATPSIPAETYAREASGCCASRGDEPVFGASYDPSARRTLARSVSKRYASRIVCRMNLLIAAGVGVLVPFALHRIGRDPAQGSSVLLTFVTDSMGFFLFLGLAFVPVNWFSNTRPRSRTSDRGRSDCQRH
jgi:hypothetical protein